MRKELLERDVYLEEGIDQAWEAWTVQKGQGVEKDLVTTTGSGMEGGQGGQKSGGWDKMKKEITGSGGGRTGGQGSAGNSKQLPEWLMVV